MQSLYNLAKKAIIPTVLAVASYLPFSFQREARGQELGGLVGKVEESEKKQPDKYVDLLDYLWRKEEIPKGFRLKHHNDFNTKDKDGIGDKNKFTNPLFTKRDYPYFGESGLTKVSVEIARGQYLHEAYGPNLEVIVLVTRRIANGKALPNIPRNFSYGKKSITDKNGIYVPIHEGTILLGALFNKGENLEAIKVDYPEQFDLITESISRLAERIGLSAKKELVDLKERKLALQKKREIDEGFLAFGKRLEDEYIKNSMLAFQKEQDIPDIENRMLAFQKIAESLRSDWPTVFNPSKLRITNIKTESFPEELEKFCRKQDDDNIMAIYAINKEDTLNFCRKINGLPAKELVNGRLYNNGWRLNPQNTQEVFHWKYDNGSIIIEKLDRNTSRLLEKAESVSLDNLVGKSRFFCNIDYVKKDRTDPKELGKCSNLRLSPDFSKVLVTPLLKLGWGKDNKASYLIDLTANTIDRPFNKENMPLSFEDSIEPDFSSNGQYLTYKINQDKGGEKNAITLLVDMKGQVFEINRTKVNYRNPSKEYSLLDPEINSEKNPLITSFIILSSTKAIGTVIYSVQKATDPLSTMHLAFKPSEPGQPPGRDFLDHFSRDGIYEIEKIAQFELSNE